MRKKTKPEIRIEDLEREKNPLKDFQIANDLQREILFREAIEKTLPSGISVADETGKQVYVNKAFCDLLGFESDELLDKKPPYVYWPKDEIQNIGNAFQQTLEGKAPKGGFDLLFEHKNGKLIPVQVVIAPFTLSNGTNFWLANTIDITDRKEAEELRQKNREIRYENDAIKHFNLELQRVTEEIRLVNDRYRGLLNNLDTGIVIHSSDTSILNSNPKAETLLGLSEDQLKGKHAIDPGWKFLAEDKTTLLVDRYPVNRIIRTKQPIKNLVAGVNRPKTKDLVWVIVNGFPVIDSKGEITEVVVSFNDITARKVAEDALRESEKKYRSIFENIQDVFYQTSLDGVIVEISPSIELLSGYSRTEMIGQPSILLYNNPEDRAVLFKAMREHKELLDYEIELKTKSGEVKYVSINARLVFADNGKAQFIEGAIRDLSERKKNELKIANQNKELEQFTYIASHDLQEPLNKLISVCDLLKGELDGVKNNDAEKYLGFIDQSSKRMQDLVKGLLDYSRIGKERELKLVDCNHLVQEVLEDMSLSVQEKLAKISVTNLPSLNAYPTELRLLFQNLISNALKFSRKESTPEIIVSAQKETQGWLFSIKDNGIGIEPEYSDKIFVIFQRLHTRKEYVGSGIGLAHCKKIVEMHGGRIWVSSNQDGGSTFNFTIPEA